MRKLLLGGLHKKTFMGRFSEKGSLKMSYGGKLSIEVPQ